MALHEERSEWVRNGTPLVMDRLLILLAGALGLGIAGLLFLVGGATGRPVLPLIFLLIFIPSTAIGLVGNRFRRPIRLASSAEGVLLQYRGGRTRKLPWHTIASVNLAHFLREASVNIRYIDGRVEDKAHVYGEAALELKRRFEQWRASS